MSDSGSAAALDRLPWLDDEPNSLRKGRSSPLWRWAPPLLIAIAIGSYWLGTRSLDPDFPIQPPAHRSPAETASRTTITLPEPRAPEAPPAVVEEPAPPAVAAVPQVRHGRAVTRKAAPRPAPRAVAKPKPKSTYWPAFTSTGASGRMVRIGTFSSRAQAKRGWARVMAIYPGMKRIPTAVVPIASRRDGKTYYRLQMGTSSQAHSEVLCQRMRIIGQSCVVVGLEEARS